MTVDTSWIKYGLMKPPSDFDSDGFRDGIRTAIAMAYPSVKERRPTFHFDNKPVYSPADSDGSPYSWTAVGTPTIVTPPDGLQVLILVEGHPVAEGEETSVGPFNADRATLYMFEDEWAQVKTFKTVTIGGDEYDRVKQLDDIVLFDVTLYRVSVAARDRS